MSKPPTFRVTINDASETKIINHNPPEKSTKPAAQKEDTHADQA